ncbi:MAG: sugar phosphate isomerase/epimerase [Isosphaeraceae bacterium]|nr:sugar phosphate isomerase/epimerase [Isosphaeraceae bacterium]
MIPCISQATTLSTPFESDLAAYSRAGFSAIEIWLTKLEDFLVGDRGYEDVRTRLAAERLIPLAAAAQGGLLLSRGAERAAHWDLFRRRLEILRRLQIPTLVVAADYSGEPSGDDYAVAAQALAEVGEVAGEFGVRIAFEFQKSARFCSSLETAAALLVQSGANNVGICLDLFHYYTGPSKFEDLAYLTRENLFWVQLNDLSATPREIAGDADRILPGDGDFQLTPILRRLHEIGYDGGVSLEVMNPMLWGIAADRVADLGYQAVERSLAAASIPTTRAEDSTRAVASPKNDREG